MQKINSELILVILLGAVTGAIIFWIFNDSKSHSPIFISNTTTYIDNRMNITYTSTNANNGINGNNNQFNSGGNSNLKQNKI